MADFPPQLTRNDGTIGLLPNLSTNDREELRSFYLEMHNLFFSAGILPVDVWGHNRGRAICRRSISDFLEKINGTIWNSKRCINVSAVVTVSPVLTDNYAGVWNGAETGTCRESGVERNGLSVFIQTSLY